MMRNKEKIKVKGMGDNKAILISVEEVGASKDLTLKIFLKVLLEVEEVEVDKEEVEEAEEDSKMMVQDFLEEIVFSNNKRNNQRNWIY